MHLNLIQQVSKLAIKISNEVLLPNFAQVKTQIKQDGSWLTIADTSAHERLTAQLPQLLDVPVLSEELTEKEQQSILSCSNASYWCIDPLDGTSNFAQGIPYWCMSIALIIDGQVKIGVVYDPNRDECFTVNVKHKTRLNGEILHSHSNHLITTLDDAMGLIDFKRLENSLKHRLIDLQPYRSQRSFGASALDFCWIAANRCQLYLHGKQKLWDYSAGLYILKGVGGIAQTLNGNDIFQNNLLSKSVIAASDSSLFKQWNEVISSILNDKHIQQTTIA